MTNDICLVCNSASKRPDNQFCSPKCTKDAASMAPQLIRVPKGHVMHNDVSKMWISKWSDSESGDPCPPISKIYLITWSVDMRTSFDAYRDDVAKKRKTPDDKAKEIKCFRPETRACRLGDSKSYDTMCSNPICRLCVGIKTGFSASLDSKEKGHGAKGISNLSTSSNKAFEHAKNLRKGSDYLAVLVTRTVLGNIQTLSAEDHTRTAPDKGFDSVKVKADGEGPLEYTVYNKDALRPAYLIMVAV